MQALKVTFKLASPLLLDSEYPIHLDGLLAYACVKEMEDGGDVDCWAKADEALANILEKTGGNNNEWVWKASKLFTVNSSSILLSNQIRKSDPEMYFMDLNSPSNPSGVWVSGFNKNGSERTINPETFKINTASGQRRGYQWLAASQWASEINAYAIGDLDAVEYYLNQYIRHIGKVGRNGFGRVASIEVTPHSCDDDWRLRVLPAHEKGKEGAAYAPVMACLRAPYWRKTDRIMAKEII